MILKSQTGFLLMMVLILGTMCMLQIVQEGILDADAFSLRHSPDDPWMPPFQ